MPTTLLFGEAVSSSARTRLASRRLMAIFSRGWADQRGPKYQPTCRSIRMLYWTTNKEAGKPREHAEEQRGRHAALPTKSQLR